MSYIGGYASWIWRWGGKIAMFWWDEAWLSVKQWRFCYYLFIVYWSEYGNNVAFVIWIKSVSCLCHCMSSVCEHRVRVKVTVCTDDLMMLCSSVWSCLSQTDLVDRVGVNASVWAIYSEEKLYEVMLVLELKTLHMKQMLCWNAAAVCKNTVSDGFVLYNNPWMHKRD